MIKIAAFILMLLLPVFVSAGTVNVLSHFNSPDVYTNGLAWDGTNLWLLGGGYDGFYELTTSGSIVSQFQPTEPGGINGCGATYDGTNLRGMFLLSTTSPGDVYEYTTSGSYVSFFTCPGTYNFGLAWDGNNLWVSSVGNNTIYELSISGTVLSSFSIAYSGVCDLAWNGTNLFLTAGYNRMIVEVTTTGTVIDTYDLSGISGSFAPTALTFDGNSFWVSDQIPDIIYEVELIGVGLQQSTFGNIKTLFN